MAALETRRARLHAVLAGATLLAALLCLWALEGGGESAPGVAVAVGYDRAADPAVSKSDWADAVRLSRAAVRRYPYDISAWMRIAFVQSKAGPMGPEAKAAIQKSYDLVAYDPDLAYWRVGFCLEHWSELTPEIRKAVSSEVHTVGADAGHRGKLIQVMRSVRDPAGRLAGAFWALDLARL
jgi:hypothetical protein